VSTAGEQSALRELSEADRVYRAAFAKLTGRGGPAQSTQASFEELTVAIERLQGAARAALHDRG
jgi:hypothetical protein